MSTCPRCRASRPEGARFCETCGAQLWTETSSEVRKTVTALYADVVGSTSMGEGLDPESLTKVMDAYFEAVKRVLDKHRGTIDNLVGDAVVAFFGLPFVNEDDALRALRAAVELREAVNSLNQESEGNLGARLQVRVGVHTGEVLAARHGTDVELSGGDVIQVAKRLQATAEPGEIRLGAPTLRRVRKLVRVKEVLSPSVEGLVHPTFELLAVSRQAPRGVGRRYGPMVGRTRERALLDWAFKRTAAQRVGMLVTIRGTAGVGKSRLLREFLADLAGRAIVLKGRCPPYGDGITYWPLSVPIRHAAGIRGEDSSEVARHKLLKLVAGEEKGERIASRVAQILGLSTEVEPGGLQQETFEAICSLLGVLAQRKPVLWVVDDLHWAEPTLFSLLEYIADSVRDIPVLIVCLARPELLEHREQWGGGQFNSLSLSISPLNEDESAQLVRHLVNQMPLPGALAEKIAGVAEGNPLFVEELVAMLVDDGVLACVGGRWIATTNLERLDVPPSVRALLDARLDRLDSAERAVLSSAAVVGKHFSTAAVIDLSASTDAGSVSASLQALVRKELIEPHSADVVGSEAFKFRHVLIRDAAYDGLAKEVRARLHEQHARWLQSTLGDRAGELSEIIGYHLRESYRLRVELGRIDEKAHRVAHEAGELLASAGRRAAIRGDLPATVSLYDKAVSLIDAGDPERLQMLLDFAEALVVMGQLSRATEVLNEAARAAEFAGDDRSTMHVMVGRLGLMQYTDLEHALGTGLDEAERAASVLEQLGDRRGLASAWRVLAHTRASRGHLELASKAVERSRAAARRVHDQRLEAQALALGCTVILHGPAHVQEVIAYCNYALDWAKSNDYLQLQAQALHIQARAYAMQERFGEARKRIHTANELYEQLGERLTVAMNSISVGFIELLAGDPVAAEQALRVGYASLDEMQAKGDASLAAMLGLALFEQGRPDEAESFATVSQSLAASHDVDAQCKWRRIRGKLLSHAGQLRQAERLARESVAIAGLTNWLDLQAEVHLDLSMVLYRAGQLVTAASVWTTAVEHYNQKGNQAGVSRAQLLQRRYAREAG